MKKLLFLLAATSILCGCQTIRYEMRAPTTDAGRYCVTQCAGIRETCRGNEIRRARNEKEDCERRADRSLHACLAGADSKERRKDCEKQQPGCWSYENYNRCDEDYRSCYQQCGGVVTRIVE